MKAVILFSFLFLLASCTNNNHNLNYTEKIDLHMTLDYDVISSETEMLQATINNNTIFQGLTGLVYTIERYEENDEWVELPFIEEIVFLLPGIFLHPKSSTNFDIFLYPNKYEYQPNNIYRVSKTVYLEDKEYILTSEFTVD